jgi:hypothetical protein
LRKRSILFFIVGTPFRIRPFTLQFYMAKLEHTKIYRGGVTASRIFLETSECSFNTNIAGRAFDLRFELASKGGGTTSVLLRIGLDDLPLILEGVAGAMPESVGTLSDCAALAHKRILEQLTEARRVQSDEKARARSLVEKLEVVEEFVSHKYHEASSGQDEQEAAAMSQLERGRQFPSSPVVNINSGSSEATGDHPLFRQSPSRLQAPGKIESRSRSIDLLNKARKTSRRTS